MLTQHDTTVPNALDVYHELRGTRLRWVGFKDIGLPFSDLRRLTESIHADGRSVVLEVVSVDRDSELRSVEGALELGVDLLMGGTHVEDTLRLLDNRPVSYFPFPGRVVGHPSVLEGTIDDITESSRKLTTMAGVAGLDLLAYRFAGDVPRLIERVVDVSAGPVVVAGSIDSIDRIRVVLSLGAWGFTIGGAIFEGLLPGAPSIHAQVESVLRIAEEQEYVDAAFRG